MNLQISQQMDAPELRNYLEFFFRHYRVMDAFWQGLKKYPCRAKHKAEVVSFAQASDRGLGVECRFAPPGAHPVDMHCQWRFYCGATL